MANCKHCARALTFNEVGLYRKLVDREPWQCLCKTCLARELSCTETLLDEKIEEFLYLECSLFRRDE